MTSTKVETETGTAAARGRPRGSTSRTDRERLREIDLDIEREELREEQRLINIARKEGYFTRRFRNGEIAGMFRTAMIADPARKVSAWELLVRQRNRLKQAFRRGQTRRNVLLGAFLTAQCRQSPALHGTVAADIRDWIAKSSDPATARRNADAIADWLKHPGTDAGDPGTGSPQAERRAHSHRMILLGAWVQERRNGVPALAERIRSGLRSFVDADGKTADRNRRLLADLLVE